MTSNGFNQAQVQSVGLLGRSGVHEGGAAPLSAISPKGELRNNQYVAPDIHDRPVHLSVVVGKDPQVEDLVGEIPDVFRTVLAPHAHQYQDTAADASHTGPADTHLRLGNPLNHGPQ
jgi:hypothetical protein